MAIELTKEEEREDWYAMLGLAYTAEEGDINKAFKKLSLRWHPDKNGGSQEAHDMFMRVKEAKLFLLDAKKRKVYDEKRAARRKMESLLAERNRSMGQRRRQLREELCRREKGAVADESTSTSGSLGVGGEARLAAVKLDELRKKGDAQREQRSQERSAAWEAARASASKKRRASSGSLGTGRSSVGDDDLEERTVRVKWSTKRESHSDHSLNILFSRFGDVESVAIEAGRGDRALVVFDSAAGADAAVAAYSDGATISASYVGRRRPKRGVFAPRRQTMSPAPARHAAARCGADIALDSFRDHESLVMMKLRQEAERQALIRKMAEEEGTTGARKGGISSANGSSLPATPTPATEATAGEDCGASGSNKSAPERPVFSSPVSSATPSSQVGSTRSEESRTPVAEGVGVGGSHPPVLGKPLFPTQSPRVQRVTGDAGSQRESDVLMAMLRCNSGAGQGDGPSSVSFGGSRSVPATPVSGVSTSSSSSALDEGDVLARMMSMKR